MPRKYPRDYEDQYKEVTQDEYDRFRHLRDRSTLTEETKKRYDRESQFDDDNDYDERR